MVSFAGFTHHAAVPSYPLGLEVWGGGLTHLQVLVTVDASLCVCVCFFFFFFFQISQFHSYAQ